MDPSIIAATTLDVYQTVQEYYELGSRQELSESEADRIEWILIQASNDPILDFWLSEMDYCLGHRLEAMRRMNDLKQQTVF